MSTDVTERHLEPSTSNGEASTILLVTGMSGAGKTSALKGLEDLGFEAIDNVPLSFLGRLLDPGPAGTSRRIPPRIAIGVDARTRDFRPHAFMREIDRLRATCAAGVRTLFLDCDDDELRRRYSETRHRHPLAQDRPISDGIQLERELMADVRDAADIVLDTTGLGPGRLKGVLNRHLGDRAAAGLTVFVVSFSYRRGLPREADLVFDVRFLSNPHYQEQLRPLTGRDMAVQAHIAADPDFNAFLDQTTGLLGLLLPRYADEGKSYLTIAVGCTGGRHRSVFVAERIAQWLDRHGHRASLRHREIDRDDETTE